MVGVYATSAADSTAQPPARRSSVWVRAGRASIIDVATGVLIEPAARQSVVGCQPASMAKPLSWPGKTPRRAGGGGGGGSVPGAMPSAARSPCPTQSSPHAPRSRPARRSTPAHLNAPPGRPSSERRVEHGTGRPAHAALSLALEFSRRHPGPGRRHADRRHEHAGGDRQNGFDPTTTDKNRSATSTTTWTSSASSTRTTRRKLGRRHRGHVTYSPRQPHRRPRCRGNLLHR